MKWIVAVFDERFYVANVLRNVDPAPCRNWRKTVQFRAKTDNKKGRPTRMGGRPR